MTEATKDQQVEFWQLFQSLRNQLFAANANVNAGKNVNAKHNLKKAIQAADRMTVIATGQDEKTVNDQYPH